MAGDLLKPDAGGLYCAAGDFWIDPLRPVPRAVITHAHADHARAGSGEYYAAEAGLPVLRQRVGQDNDLVSRRYGEHFELGDTRITLFPAGHILGSATVRIESEEGAWGVSGDFKRDPDPTCRPFEPFDCDVWLTECTFGLPVYRWPPTETVIGQVLDWWRECAGVGRPAVLFCYALGKAQRLLSELDRHERPGRIWLHGAMQALTRCYREQGIPMPDTHAVGEAGKGEDYGRDLVLAPPSAAGSPWMKRFRNHSTGFVSGWMRIRGNRRRRGYDRGFVLSDHADWPGLVDTAADMRSGRVITIHGDGTALAGYLQEQGLAAESWNLRETLSAS
ncbi:MAG: ligase-associated DNA damage response exonuclease [Gammaproteobacteria bacterium]|jgi:putative mRNA 3-end processing factor|nr:ligase-associated DNA damage response exonuclease [Gammaproteobacteria bacterium]NBD95444.1 ligase-associated DNA damage response exonuclease [Gammaproteobacteria bacterium]